MFISVSEHPHFIFEQVCIQLPTSALNVTLLAFAAERRAAAPLLVGARRRRRCRSISTFYSPHGAQQQAHRTPHAARRGQMMGQTDRKITGLRCLWYIILKRFQYKRL